MVFPWASVMVIMVLLKLAFTCAVPDAMFLRSRRRTRVVSFPIHDPFAAGLAFRPPPPPASPASGGGREGRSGRGGGASRLLLLAGNRLGRALPGPGIGMRALAANRQAAPMPQPAIAAEIHQPLDVH